MDVMAMQTKGVFSWVRLYEFRQKPSLSFLSLWRRDKSGGIAWLLDRKEVKSYLFYGYGRVTLLEGLKILACDEGNNVLLPAYICEVAIETFHELGIEPRFYELSPHLQPDMEEIKNKIDMKTRGVMFVNYFGFPSQNLEEIRNICEKFGIFLIEDNDHGFLSCEDSRLLV